VDTQGVRVLDLLNKEDSDFLTILDPVFQGTGEDSAASDSLTARKSRLSLVVSGDCARDATPAKRYFAYAPKNAYMVRLLLDSLLVDGVIHAKGKVDDFRWFLTQEVRQFFPVTNARITRTAADAEHRYSASAALVNIAAVIMVQPLAQAPSDKSRPNDKQAHTMAFESQVAEVLAELRRAD
jgi:hypothetical protein